MHDRSPSATAARVAAARAGFTRVAAPFGDPAADERLARDLATAVATDARDLADRPGPSDAMRGYLQARTRFFDRAVVNAIERHVRQIVLVGAGYDGRGLRYAAPGTRFFEVDHAATQADKLDRLARLGIDREAITFVAVDLAGPGLIQALRGAELEPEAPSLFICEGLLVYLEPAAVEGLLGDLRALAGPGTRLALSATAAGRRTRPEHVRLQARVSQLGEPARNDLQTDALRAILAAHRWRPVELSDRAATAGFLVAAPEWAPATRGLPATESRVGRYLETALHRAGDDTLLAHLSAAHGMTVTSRRELDVGVFDVRCAGNRRCVVRVFPTARGERTVTREATLLGELAARGFPAERPAGPRPVGRHLGQPLLITEYVDGRRGSATAASCRRLGELLGWLHGLEVSDWDLAPGGAWHHLVPAGGGPDRELRAIGELLAAAKGRLGRGGGVGARDAVRAGGGAAYARLGELLAQADDCAGLPDALIHPDFVPANAIGAGPVIVDGAGSGRGPRLWSLAFLLWAAGRTPGGVEAAIEGYETHITLEREECDRLAAAMLARPVVLAAWSFVTARRPLDQAVAEAERAYALVPRLAARASGRTARGGPAGAMRQSAT